MDFEVIEKPSGFEILHDRLECVNAFMHELLCFVTGLVKSLQD